VHSLAAALFLPVSKIHWFGDVGYRHNPWTHCPQDDLSHSSGRCLCPRDDNFDENVGPISIELTLGLFMSAEMVEIGGKMIVDDCSICMYRSWLTRSHF
jgi:hypothetical protein